MCCDITLHFAEVEKIVMVYLESQPIRSRRSYKEIRMHDSSKGIVVSASGV